MSIYLEIIKRIYRKTQLLFIIVLAASFIIIMLFSFYEFSKYKYIPDYNSVIKIDESFNLENKYHIIYFKQFIFNNSISLLLKNLLIISIIFYIFCFSLYINKSDLITTDNKKIDFPKISLHGLYILIGLTILQFIASEFLVPFFENKSDWMKNNTSRAIISLNKGNELYKNNIYKEALYYYEEYIIIIEKDDTIDSRIHEIRNKIQINAYKENKEKSMINKLSTNEATTDYLKLAENYFQKKDYYTALYYYTFIAESNIQKSEEAKEKIKIINKILRYNNDLNINKSTLNNEELNKYINKKDNEIRDIYVLKNQADKLMNNNEYLKAYFVYDDILKINPNLDEVINAKNDAYRKVKEIGAEIEDLMLSKNYPGKSNFVFMFSQNRLMHIGLITKGKNKFYLYDIKIYSFDINYNFKNVIEAPYGETKSPDTFTLYSFSLNNRETANLPMITYANSKKETYSEYIFKLPSEMKTLYNFSYDYKKTFNSSLINLFRLNNLISKNKNFSIGFNNNFIKSAITEKISFIFIFFSLNLIFIGLSWRFRSNYVMGTPKIHYIILFIIPIFVYKFVNLLQKYVSTFYSSLAFSLNLYILLILCFILNIIIMLFSIIYTASTK